MDSRDYRNGVPVGWPGHISRRENLATEPRHTDIDPDNTPAAYGLAVALTDDGDITALTDGATAADIYGFNVAPEFSTFTPKPQAGIMGDVMRQGYMTVAVASGAVKANGAVYVRVSNADDDHPLGEILAEEVTSETVIAANARFVGPSTAAADGSCIAEIAFNL